jgi:Zn-dependent peptidase ImmA (M78 family)/DNA-binding XRE family transcriptional regulator
MELVFNREMLTLAREIRGMTQPDLAKASGLSQATISRYEQDISPVSKKDLDTLARVLGFPTSFFYQEGKRRGPEASEIFHRKRVTLSAKDLKRIDGLLNLYRLGTDELLKPFEQIAPYQIPSMGIKEYGSASRIAAKVRALWRMPSGPVGHLIEQLEEASCLVFSYDFGTEKMDENTQWVEPAPPIILVNSRASGDRLRFSLAHALGHLVMHHNRVTPDEEEEEHQADEFAASFLMPAEDIENELSPVAIDHMMHLKRQWAVSIQALIRRAVDLEVISSRRYTTLMTQLSKAGYRKKEPFSIPAERPKLIKKLIKAYQTELKYSDEELAQLLHLSIADFRHWYKDEPKLQFVDKERIIG